MRPRLTAETLLQMERRSSGQNTAVGEAERRNPRDRRNPSKKKRRSGGQRIASSNNDVKHFF